MFLDYKNETGSTHLNIDKADFVRYSNNTLQVYMQPNTDPVKIPMTDREYDRFVARLHSVYSHYEL